MKKALIIGIFVAAIPVFFTKPAYSQRVVGEKIKYAQEVKDSRTESLEEEIKTVNLLNNLNLKKEQLEAIIRHARDIEQTRKGAYAELSRFAGRMYRLERKIQKEVESGRTVLEDDLVKEYSKILGRRDLLFFRINDKIKDGIRATEAMMEEFQLLALDEYIPRIIPIVKDDFIGGIGKCRLFMCFLRKGRKIPGKKYEIDKEKYISQDIEVLKNRLALGKELCDEAIVREEIAKSLEQARNLDDVDFKLQEKKMAEELAQKIILEEPGLSRQKKIQRFLLSSQSIPILEKKLRRERPQ